MDILIVKVNFFHFNMIFTPQFHKCIRGGHVLSNREYIHVDMLC
uniref:Uncharacterized protein n=1 Tax=Rhizophora mucronata TaxID=61149 RepID=A0A2P2NBT4_RHIMU